MADPDLQISGGRGGGGGGASNLPKNSFRPFGPHFGRKIRGLVPSPGSATGDPVVTQNSSFVRA